MATELRKTGISVVGDMPWGTHFCSFYESKEDLLDTLVPYFKAGLGQREFCVWVIADPLTREEARNALRLAVPDLDRHESEQSIEMFLGKEWYLQGGTLDLNRITNAWSEKLDQALARGYQGLRVSGDTCWLQKSDWQDFCTYETLLNESISNQPMTLLCTYPLARSGAAEILDVTRTHQFAIARRQGDWEVIETLQLKQARAELRKLNEELEQRVIDRTRELAAVNEKLRESEEQLRATTEQLRALSARLESAREEEGARIAREIHDELGSALTTLKWDLETIDREYVEAEDNADLVRIREKIAAMMQLIDATTKTMKRISGELRPSILDDIGLVEAIDWQAQQFQNRTGIICNCDCGLENVELTPEQSTAMFRIFQEALTNILRHAKATQVDVAVKQDSGKLVLTIKDNGRGISEEEKSRPESLGLLGMRERVSLIGGQIDITGVEGEGTVVTVRVPVSG